MSPLLNIALTVVLLGGAVTALMFLDRWRYRKRDQESLSRQVREDHGGKRLAALKELRRRGLQTDQYVRVIVQDLLSPSMSNRSEAIRTLQNFFPHIWRLFPNFSPWQKPAKQFLRHETAFRQLGVTPD